MSGPPNPGPKPPGDPAVLRAASTAARDAAKFLSEVRSDVNGIAKGHWFEGPGRHKVDAALRGAAADADVAGDNLRSAARALDHKADEIADAQAKWLIADIAHRAWQVAERLL